MSPNQLVPASRRFARPDLWLHGLVVALAAILLAAILFAGSARLSERHALAYAPSCTNQLDWDYCTGADPQSEGCVAQYTVSASVQYYNSTGQFIDNGEMDNRYAPNCRSNWGRTLTDCCADPLYASISGTDPYYGYYSNTAGLWSTTTILWSAMIFAPSITTTACGGFPDYGYSNIYPPQACRNQ